MMRLEQLYRLRLTLKSGRQLDQWVSRYALRTSTVSGEIVTLNLDPADHHLPRLLAFSLTEIAAIELTDRKRRLRFGKGAR